MKEIIIKVSDEGHFSIPFYIKYTDNKNKKYKILYKGKYYEKEQKDIKIRQVSQLVQALNIKNKKQRLEFIYDKACDLLDDDFYGKNVCEFKNNKCMHDRKYNNSCDGCCRTNDGGKCCIYLKNHKCTIRCLACKFHICSCVRKKNLNYKVNDILVLKYLLNFKQKIIVYLNFFKTKQETINDLEKNSIILWTLKKEQERFLEDNN